MLKAFFTVVYFVCCFAAVDNTLGRMGPDALLSVLELVCLFAGLLASIALAGFTVKKIKGDYGMK